MKFNRKVMTVTVIRVSKPQLTPNARNLLNAQRYLKFKDYKRYPVNAQAKVKHSNERIIKRLAGFSNEYSVGLQVVDKNGEPFWVNSYSNHRYSDKRGVSNLPKWIAHHIQPNQAVRVKLVGTNSGYLLTNISNVSKRKPINVTKLVPKILQAQGSKKPAK